MLLSALQGFTIGAFGKTETPGAPASEGTSQSATAASQASTPTSGGGAGQQPALPPGGTGSPADISALDSTRQYRIGERTLSGSQVRDALRDANLTRRFQSERDNLRQENDSLRKNLSEFRSRLEAIEQQGIVSGLLGGGANYPTYAQYNPFAAGPLSREASDAAQAGYPGNQGTGQAPYSQDNTDFNPWEATRPNSPSEPNAQGQPGVRYPAAAVNPMQRQAADALVKRAYAGINPDDIDKLIEQKVQQRLGLERQKAEHSRQIDSVHQRVLQSLVQETGIAEQDAMEALASVREALGVYDQLAELKDDGNVFEAYGDALSRLLKLSPKLGRAVAAAEDKRRLEELDAQVLKAGASPSSSQAQPADTDTMSDEEYYESIRGRHAKQEEIRRSLR